MARISVGFAGAYVNFTMLMWGIFDVPTFFGGSRGIPKRRTMFLATTSVPCPVLAHFQRISSREGRRDL